MYKVLFNKCTGLRTPVLDYKETKKRIKVVNLDGSYSLWYKDSNAVEVNTLIEGKDKEDVDKKIDNYVIDSINSDFDKLLQLINFETLASLMISVLSYRVIFYWMNFNGTGTCSEFKINIPSTVESGQSGKYYKIISNLVHKYIISRKEIYKKKYRTYATYATNELIKVIDSSDFVYKPFDGLYIHRDNIVNRLPEEPIHVGKKYAIGSYKDCLSIYIPNKCRSVSISYNFRETDKDMLKEIPFSLDELSEIKKSVKFASNDESKVIIESIEGIIVVKGKLFICIKTPYNEDTTYEYEEITSSIGTFKVMDKIYSLKNNKNTFKFILPDFIIYGSEDFVFEELSLVENESAMYGKILKFKSFRGYALREDSDSLMEISHTLPLLLSEMKKQLGQNNYNTWMLMNDIQ